MERKAFTISHFGREIHLLSLIKKKKSAEYYIDVTGKHLRESTIQITTLHKLSKQFRTKKKTTTTTQNKLERERKKICLHEIPNMLS